MARPVKYPRLVLNVRFQDPSHRSQYGHIIASIVEHRPEHAGTDWEFGPVYTSDIESGGKYAHLEITSQTEFDHLARAADNDLMYGVELEWGSSCRRLRDMREGVAALSEIEKKVDKMTAEYGPPASFGAYVARVAKAVGIGQVRIPRTTGG